MFLLKEPKMSVSILSLIVAVVVVQGQTGPILDRKCECVSVEVCSGPNGPPYGRHPLDIWLYGTLAPCARTDQVLCCFRRPEDIPLEYATWSWAPEETVEAKSLDKLAIHLDDHSDKQEEVVESVPAHIYVDEESDTLVISGGRPVFMVHPAVVVEAAKPSQPQKGSGGQEKDLISLYQALRSIGTMFEFILASDQTNVSLTNNNNLDEVQFVIHRSQAVNLINDISNIQLKRSTEF